MTQSAAQDAQATRILLVDLSHLFWSAYHATKDAGQSGAFEIALDKAHRLRDGYQWVAFCCDSPPYKRKQVFEGYKANRDPAPPVVHDQFDRLKQRLRRDGLLLWAAPGYEADDVIATAVKRALELDEPVRVTIASNDKDLLQLVRDPEVHYVSTATGAWMLEAEVEAKFGVPPRLIGDWLALVGDKSDGIAGVPGVGPKNASNWLHKHGSLEAALAAALTEKVGAVQDAIVKHAEQARLARKLVELDSTAPINFDEIFEERTPEPLVETNMADLDSTADLGEEPQAPPPPAPESFEGELVPSDRSTAEKPKPKPASQAPNGTAIVHADLPFEMQLQPRSIAGAAALGKAIFNSRLFQKFPNEDATTAVILRGREMGLTALTALQCFHFFENQLVMHAHLIVAKVEEHPDCEYFEFIGGDDTYAEYETKKRGATKPVRLKYTIDQAKQAGLCPDEIRTRNPTPGDKDSRKAWEKRPAELLRKTCAVQLGRVVYPSAALGIYAIEELGGE